MRSWVAAGLGPLGVTLLATLGCAELASAQTRGTISVPEVEPIAEVAGAPAWVVEGVPDTVWALVEASSGDFEEDDEWRALLEEAETHARTAVQETDDVGRRFALAVVLGMRANREGGRTMIRKASELHTELETVLELDPEHARARHMMGRLHAGVRRLNRVTRWIATNLLGGGELKKATWEGAEENLLFAEQHAPEVSDHHLQLANLYRDTDRHDLALQELQHVFELRPTSAMERAVYDEAIELWDKLSG